MMLDDLIRLLDKKRLEVEPKNYDTSAYLMSMTELCLVIGYLKKLRASLDPTLK